MSTNQLAQLKEDAAAANNNNGTDPDHGTPPPASMRDTISGLTEVFERALPDLPGNRSQRAAAFTEAVVATLRYDQNLFTAFQHDRAAVVGAVLSCAQLGLTPGRSLGEAWVIARKDRKRPHVTYPNGKKDSPLVASLQIGYKGWIALARRTGTVGQIRFGWATPDEIESHDFGIVAGDFTTNFVVRPRRVGRLHLPDKAPETAPTGELAEVTYFALVEVLGESSSVAMSMTAPEVWRHYQAHGKHSDAWRSHYPQMAAVSAFRSGARLLPMTADKPDLARALNIDGQVRRSVITSADQFDAAEIDAAEFETPDADEPTPEPTGTDEPTPETEHPEGTSE